MVRYASKWQGTSLCILPSPIRHHTSDQILVPREPATRGTSGWRGPQLSWAAESEGGGDATSVCDLRPVAPPASGLPANQPLLLSTSLRSMTSSGEQRKTVCSGKGKEVDTCIADRGKDLSLGACGSIQ